MTRDIISHKAASDTIEVSDLKELITLFGQLNDRNRQVLIGFATSMVKEQNGADNEK